MLKKIFFKAKRTGWWTTYQLGTNDPTKQGPGKMDGNFLCFPEVFLLYYFPFIECYHRAIKI